MYFPDAASRGIIPIHRVLQIFLLFCVLLRCETFGVHLFKPGKQYTYKYYAETNTGVSLPSKAASSFGISGQLKIQAKENSTIIQLESVRTFAWNGKYEEKTHSMHPSVQAEEMSKPFRVVYNNGLLTNFSVEDEAVWATNIKRSIAGILQLDLANLQKDSVFQSIENNHYGQCTIEYVVTPEDDGNTLVRKFSDPRECVGHPHWTWANVPGMNGPNDDEIPLTKSSERLYKVKSDGSDSTIVYVNATGGIYVQPFPSLWESHFVFTRQSIELISTEESMRIIEEDKFHDVVLQHELPSSDVIQGGNTHNKQAIFSSISKLLDLLSQRFENPGLDTDMNNLHNTTISSLLYYLGLLAQSDLKLVYDKITGTSYSEQNVRYMFLEILPQVGTEHSALFVLDLILTKKVSDGMAWRMLTYLPFNIRKASVNLLTSMEVLLDLPKSEKPPKLRNAGILMFGTLIYKTCLSYCSHETLDNYVRLYLDRFTESSDYDEKMVWLEGLSNIQLGRVVELLGSIASGNSVEYRHLRVLAAWASLPTAPLRPDVIYPVYWPIFVNRTEHLELRIAALTLLMVSKPSSNRIISLYWYMHDEPDRHLYNFFYTTLKSMERTNFSSYKHTGRIAAQLIRVLRKPSPNENIVTGNYLFDYQDTKRHFGAMVQNLIIANPLSNMPEVVHITLNSHGSGTNLNDISLYVKAEGLVHSLSSYLESPTRVKDILKDFKIEEKPRGEEYVEIIVRVQQKAVLCLRYDYMHLIEVILSLTYLAASSTIDRYKRMDFYVLLQRINVPLTMESVQATDLGTNVRLAVTATSLFSMTGNFTVSSNALINVIIRAMIHRRVDIEAYNPLIDVWHGAERAQSIHGYLPINMTMGVDNRLFLLYNTPAGYRRMGVTVNVRTATSVRGHEAPQRFRRVCPNCATLYTVKQSDEPLKETSLFEAVVPELGGRLHVKVFNCEASVDQENYLGDVFSSHRSNYQNWQAARLSLLIVHLLDFFTYVPPTGNCGLSIYVEPTSFNPPEVKLEYEREGSKLLLELVTREFGTREMLRQWDLAAVYRSSWFSNTLNIEASKSAPGGNVMEVFIEAEAVTPWAWDFLSMDPSEPASVKFNISWDDWAKPKSSILVSFVGEVTLKQLEESKRNVWPYNDCRQQSAGKKSVPYTEACYEASKELSTLRKYQAFVQTTNLTDDLGNVISRLRAFYNVLGDNDSRTADSNKFVIGATFPKDSKVAEVHVNGDTSSFCYEPEIIDIFLVRMKLHKLLDNVLFRSMFSVCTLTRTVFTTADNVTLPLTENRVLLLLAQCHKSKSQLALRAIGTSSGVTLISDDKLGSIKIVPEADGLAVYNFTERLTFKKDFQWNFIDNKRMRLDRKSIHLFLSDYFIFIHVTEEQVLVFFPNYMKESSCGFCTATSLEAAKSYEKQ